MLWLWIIIGVVLIFLLINMTKAALKLIGYGIILLVFVSVLSGIIIWKDKVDFESYSKLNDNLYILEDGEEIAAAYSKYGSGEPVVVDEPDLQEKLKDKTYASQYYKIITFTRDINPEMNPSNFAAAVRDLEPSDIIRLNLAKNISVSPRSPLFMLGGKG